MQISVVTLYLIWYLISSSMNQIANTTPVSQTQSCFSCSTYYLINYPITNEFYTSCNSTFLCGTREKSCGIKIEKFSNGEAMKLSLGCFNNEDCKTKKLLPATNITFSEELHAVECCDGALCNKKANLPMFHLVLGKKVADNHDKKCIGFIDNHQQIYLTDESDNIQKIKANDNLLIGYKDIDKNYIKRHAISATWYAVFQDKAPYKEVKIASFSKDKQGKFIKTDSDSYLINKEKIFYITHEAIYLCNFNLRDLNIILNKIVTNDGHTRLFGVVLTDKDVVPHAQGIIGKIKNRNITKVHQLDTSNLDKQNNMLTKEILINNQNNTATRDLLSNIIMLIPLIGVADFN